MLTIIFTAATIVKIIKKIKCKTKKQLIWSKSYWKQLWTEEMVAEV